MKKYILKKIESSLRKQYPNYNDEKIEIIMYGIEGLYITITKCIIIFSIALLLGIFKELILLLLFFNIVRLVAFGMHAPNGIICLILSSLMFISISYFVAIITIPLYGIIIAYILCLISVILFAPADTEKHPLIKKKRRLLYKIISILLVFAYFIICILIKNTLLINAITFGLIIECVLINPLSYKLFKLPYNNYKTYDLNTK